ncbi:MAG TPA: SAM-dependent chlorinase/fluorinase [Pyrinomonadaceae bacterium]
MSVIALLTDFGTADYYVGAMKGVILSINSVARVVDITHEVSPQDIASASFILRACYGNFPQKTIFVAIVDPGVGSPRKAILVETEDYFFIAPDNGLLSFVFNEKKIFRVFELTNEKFFLPRFSSTFHGRDIFAPCAAYLSNGTEPEEFGNEIKDFVCYQELKPQTSDENEIEATIINIDRFGNIVTNIKQENAPNDFVLSIDGNIIEKLYEYYSEAIDSEAFMIWGSAGYLEISVFKDSAAKKLAAQTGQKIKLLRKS